MSDAWRRANELFHLALDQPDADRDRFLTDACGVDEALRAEVRSLLEAHRRAEGFLESPAVTGGQATRAGGDAAELLIGRQIGQYRVERILGRGGMGVVYLADDMRLGRRVALKAVSPEFTHDPTRRERLRREARTAAALTHPGIATIYALEEVGEHAFIASEYVPGDTLRDELNRGALAPSRVLDTAVALANALAAAHDRGIVHRDLKPENVIRLGTGGIKILDFGLAQMRASSEHRRLTADDAVMGTPAYMAPEQIRRGDADARSDLFSLGVVLFECLTGRHPFEGRDTASTIARILETEPDFSTPTGTTDDRDVWDALGKVIRTCIHKSPDARFSSAHALLVALDQVCHRGTWSSGTMALPEGGPIRWWKFHQAATCVTYAALMGPLWLAHFAIEGRPGFLVFLAGLVAAVAACVLRLHLWFAVSSIPEEWRAQRDHSRPWLWVAEITLVAALAGAGLSAIDNPALAALLVSAAVAVLLSFVLIEPATTRAAFRVLSPPERH
jgi:predicted Ser/Thr protein kinase